MNIFGTILNNPLVRELKFAVRSQTAGQAWVYVATTALNSSIPILLMPILTRYLTPAGYGHVAILQAILSVMFVVLSAWCQYPLLRFATVNSTGKSIDYLASTLPILAGTTLAAALIMAATRTYVAHQIGISGYWALGAIAAASAQALMGFYLTFLRAKGRAMAYGTVQIGASASNAALSLILIVVLGMDWYGRAYAVVVSPLLFVPVVVLLLRRDGLIGHVRSDYVKSIVLLGGAALPHSAFGVAMTFADRFFLGAEASMHEVGVYTIASQLAQGLVMLAGAFNLALAPWAYRQLNVMRTRADAKKLLRRAMGMAFLIVIGTCLFYLAIVLAFPLLAPPEYGDAMRYLPWLMGGACLNCLYFVFSQPIFYYKRVAILSVSGVFILASGLLIIWLFYRQFGIVGVAMGMFGARLILFLISLVSGIYLVNTDLRRQTATTAP